MEQKLFALLTKHVNITRWVGEVYESPTDSCFPKFYLMELATVIDIFVAASVNRVEKTGYSGGLFYNYIPNSALLHQIETLIPSSTCSYDRKYLSDTDCYEIEKIFDNNIQIGRVYYQGSPQSKGYGFRIEYAFRTKRDVSKEAENMLQYIVKVLSNGDLKKALVEKQAIEETLERARVAKLKEEQEQWRQGEEDRKKKYDEEHGPKYVAILKRSEGIVVPKRKKEALRVAREDFASLMYAIRQYSYKDYPNDEAHALTDFFREYDSIKVWRPNDILHCMTDDNEEFTMKKGNWRIAILPVKKRGKVDEDQDS